MEEDRKWSELVFYGVKESKKQIKQLDELLWSFKIFLNNI